MDNRRCCHDELFHKINMIFHSVTNDQKHSDLLIDQQPEQNVTVEAL